MLDEQGLIDGGVVESTLAEAANHATGRRVTVICSGEDVLLTQAQVPTGSAAQAKKAIPFSLEESLVDDVDDLHFAIGKPDDDQHYPVAIVSRECMDTLKQQCEDAGLHPGAMVPEPLAVPIIQDDENNPWCAVLANGRTILRQRDYAGFTVETSNFSPILDRALREAKDDAPRKLNVYNVGNTEKPPMTIATATANCSNTIEVFARGLETPRIDLLQGDYSRRQQFGKHLKPWKMTGVLLLLLVLIWGGSSAVEYVRLGQQETQLTNDIRDVYISAFPNARNVPDPAKQMRLKLRDLGSGGGGFIASFGDVSKAISADKDIALNSINYRDGRMDIEIEAARLDQFDALKKRIDSGGKLTASIQSANKEGDRVRGRVRINPR